MNTFYDSIVINPVVIACGWTLFHSVWQIALVTVFAGVGLKLLNSARPVNRYYLTGFSMVLILVASVLTFCMEFAQANIASKNQVASIQTGTAHQRPLSRITFYDPQTDIQNDATGADESNVEKFDASPIQDWSEPFPVNGRWLSIAQWAMPILTIGWLVGVALLFIRTLCGFAAIRKWIKNAKPIENKKILSAFESLVKKMRCSKTVQLLSSNSVSVPSIIGLFRPVVLVPTSMISGLSVEDLESILAHELAHVRRQDYLFNILQVAIETLFFYHPAMWWLSNRMRIEREFCCDDAAVQLCENPLALVKALTKLEEIRSGEERWVVAATGGSLLTRIQRLTGLARNESLTWPIAFLTAFLSLFLFCWLFVSSVSASPSPTTTPTVIPSAEASQVIDDEESTKQVQYKLKKIEVKKTDRKTSTERSVLADVELRTQNGSEKTSRMDVMYSNAMMYSFIPQRVAKALDATELGTIDFGKDAPPNPGQKQVRSALEKGKTKKPTPAKTEKHYTVNEVTKPLTNGKIVPYGTEPIWVPGHLGVYGMNKTKQHVFKVVRIDRVDLGFGLPFGPINALVSNDDNSEFGVLGRDWAQLVTGTKNEVMWWSADGTFFLMKKGQSPQPAKKMENPTPVETAEKKQDAKVPKIYIDKKVNGKITRAYFKAKRKGRSPVDVLKSNAAALLKRRPEGLNITEMETIVSAKPRYLLGRGMDTNELMMSLPEGSKSELVLSGENVQVETKEDHVTIVTTNGKVQWVDSVGTVRATATADGGMKHLVIQCTLSNDEVVAVIKTLAMEGEDKHPVQVIMNVETGERIKETPPHGSVRFEIEPWNPSGNEPARMKIKYRYEMKRVAQEAEEITGKKWHELIEKE